MEKTTSTIEFNIARNAGRCIATGFFLYADNFRRLFRASWLSALVYAVLFAILGGACVTELPRIMVTALMRGSLEGLSLWQPLTLITILTIVGGVAEVMFYSVAVSFLRGWEQPRAAWKIDRNAALRCIIAALWWVAFTIVPNAILWFLFDWKLRFALLDPFSHKVLFAATLAFIIIVAVLLLPLIPITMAFVLKPETKMVTLLKAYYVKGLRRCPFILAVCFVNLCVMAVAGFIIQQPAIIIMTANIFANMGTLYGDPLGMPHYISTLTLAVFALAGFLQAYIRMAVIFPTYYMLGSLQTREEARLAATSTIKDEKETALY